MRKKQKKQPRSFCSSVVVFVVFFLFLIISLNLIFIDQFSKKAGNSYQSQPLDEYQDTDALASYPAVKKLVAEGDVSYDDALVMVGLKKPRGKGALGGDDDDVVGNPAKPGQKKKPRQKIKKHIRNARTKQPEKRKHADHPLAPLLTDEEIDLENKLSTAMKDLYYNFVLERHSHSFTSRKQDGTLLCLDYRVDQRTNGPLSVYKCHRIRADIKGDSTQAFVLTKTGILKSKLHFDGHDVEGCLIVIKSLENDYRVTETEDCGEDDTGSQWDYKESTGLLRHKATATCVSMDFEKLDVRVEECNDEKVPSARLSLKRLPATAILKDDPKALKPETNDFAFNVSASIEVGSYRPIKDDRPEQCATDYRSGHDINGKALSKTASIIFCFYNEEWFALVRSVWSSIMTAPPHLIKEVILVDDGSYLPWLLKPLEEYLDAFRHVIKARVVRAPKRDGLITARLLGAEKAVGDVLVFLDSHVEPAQGWLEPMLWSIEDKRDTVVCPQIPTTTWENLELEKSNRDVSIGIFDWTLTFTWRTLKKNEKKDLRPQDPVNSPTMAGGLFAIERDYFYEIGSYDSGMKMWGGENLEMSFRIWMCGGKLVIHPCSKFYHIYRKHVGHENKRVGNYFRVNNNRLAEVWMDDYKEIYYATAEKLEDSVVGDLTDRKELRERLQCKSFKWYLDTLMPKMFIPDADHALCLGEIRNPKTNHCLDTYGKKTSGVQLKTYTCHGEGGSQAWWYTKGHEIRTLNENCVDIYREKDQQNAFVPHLEECHGMGGNQRFHHDGYPGHPGLFRHDFGNCLQVNSDAKKVEVQVTPCNTENKLQLWICEEYPQYGR